MNVLYKLRHVEGDPQRGALYSLERGIEGNCVRHTAPRKYLTRLARRACRYYGVTPATVRFVNRPRQREFAWIDEEWVIHLNRGFHGQNTMTLLHELTHYIVDDRYEDYEDHGPEFCAVYMHLLHRFKILPEDAFRTIARRWHLRIAKEYLPRAIE